MDALALPSIGETAVILTVEMCGARARHRHSNALGLRAVGRDSLLPARRTRAAGRRPDITTCAAGQPPASSIRCPVSLPALRCREGWAPPASPLLGVNSPRIRVVLAAMKATPRTG